LADDFRKVLQMKIHLKTAEEPITCEVDLVANCGAIIPKATLKFWFDLDDADAARFSLRCSANSIPKIHSIVGERRRSKLARSAQGRLVSGRDFCDGGPGTAQ